MTTTQITYGKRLSVVSQDLNSNIGVVYTAKISELENIISEVDCFAIRLNNTVLKRTIKRIESLGFDITIDENYGFEWECKLYCSL